MHFKELIKYKTLTALVRESYYTKEKQKVSSRQQKKEKRCTQHLYNTTVLLACQDFFKHYLLNVWA